jgi:hypothetical protein
MARFPRCCTRSLAFVLLSAPAFAADVSLRLDAGAGFTVKDDTGAIERLRVDEASGNVSRNGALFVHTTGSLNTFVGSGAGNVYVTGSSNTGFGAYALAYGYVGGENTAVGLSALRFNYGGSSNSAFGASALRVNDGDESSAFGPFALTNNLVGSNSAFGAQALQATQGSHDSVLGRRALFANTTGSGNSAVGSSALRDNLDGGANSAFGQIAMLRNTTGYENTALGRGALYSNTSGSRNIAIGSDAGYGQTTGNDNIYLDSLGVAGESGRIRIGSIGTHTQTQIAGIHGATSAGGIAVLVDPAGRLGTTTSSARFKQDVREMGDASDLLMRLRPVSFRYKPEAAPGEDGTQYGLIAAEVAQVAPELVALDAAGQTYSVKYHVLPALLLAQNQQQQRTIEAQREALAALGARVAQLESLRRPPAR